MLDGVGDGQQGEEISGKADDGVARAPGADNVTSGQGNDLGKADFRRVGNLGPML